MKALILSIFVLVNSLVVEARAQDFGSGFANGMRAGQRARELENQREALELQQRALEQQREANAQAERDRAEREEREREESAERDKNERIKLKLEALKIGYELDEDGNLKKIEKKTKSKAKSDQSR